MGDRSRVRKCTPPAATDEALTYMFAIGSGATGSGATGSGATGSGATGSMLGVPMPAEAVGVGLIELLADVDMPVMEPMPVMVDVGLMVVGIEVTGIPLDMEIDVGPGVGENDREICIPAGTCETWIGETFARLGADRPAIIEAGLIATAEVAPAVANT
jgi:hypothetical protein